MKRDTEIISSVLLHCFAVLTLLLAPGMVFGHEYALTTGYYSETDDLDAAVEAELGPGAKVGDWADVKALYSGQIAAFCDSIGLVNYRDGAICRRNGVGIALLNRHYFMERHDGVVPSGWNVHDHIDSYTLSLGSYFNLNKRILVELPHDPYDDVDLDGYTPAGGDCDDDDAAINPGATEVCGDGIDQDCDGVDLQCPSLTADQFTLTSARYSGTDDLEAAVEAEFGPNAWIADFADVKTYFTGSTAAFCDTVGLLSYRDGAICLRNGAHFIYSTRHYFLERHDGVVPSGWLVHDQIDSNTISLGSWYTISKPILVRLPFGIDADHDGDGFSIREGDFDDDDPSINPGAIELCNDGIDQDCDGEDLLCIMVPGDFPTIQAALDAAAPYDTIEVAAGTWSGPGNRELELGGKPLTLRCAPGPDPCILQGDTGYRLLNFESGEGPDTIVSGFTLENGEVRYGGAVSIIDASPTLIACTIRDNYGEESGGGIYCDHGAPHLIDCVFESNRARFEHGGGFFGRNGCTPVLEGCRFTGNRSSTGSGGGIFLSNGSDAIIRDSSFVSNLASAHGGGLYATDSDPVLERCVLSRNVDLSAERAGGGIQLVYSDAQLTNCIIADSSSGGLFLAGSSPQIVNCTITENFCYGCTGGIVVSNGSSPTIRSSIVWGNSGYEQIEVQSGVPVVQYSDIEDLQSTPFTGSGNFDADPLFVDTIGGDFHLDVGSPCIDAGTLSGAPADDIDLEPRPQGGGIDVGADESSTS